MNNSQGLKGFIKRNFRGAYDVAGAFYHGLEAAKIRRLSEESSVATHISTVDVDAPLKTITINSEQKRLNIVLKHFSEESLINQEIAELLTEAINYANQFHVSLRIISRNELPNPRFFTDFIQKNQLIAPESYSFYTDSDKRLSSPVRRLDISKHDVIFTEKELVKFKKWITKK